MPWKVNVPWLIPSVPQKIEFAVTHLARRRGGYRLQVVDPLDIETVPARHWHVKEPSVGLEVNPAGRSTVARQARSPIRTCSPLGLPDGGKDRLDYDLFQDPGRTIHWGDRSGVDTLEVTATGAQQTDRSRAFLNTRATASDFRHGARGGLCKNLAFPQQQNGAIVAIPVR